MTCVYKYPTVKTDTFTTDGPTWRQDGMRYQGFFIGFRGENSASGDALEHLDNASMTRQFCVQNGDL